MKNILLNNLLRLTQKILEIWLSGTQIQTRAQILIMIIDLKLNLFLNIIFYFTSCKGISFSSVQQKLTETFSVNLSWYTHSVSRMYWRNFFLIKELITLWTSIRWTDEIREGISNFRFNFFNIRNYFLINIISVITQHFFLISLNLFTIP